MLSAAATVGKKEKDKEEEEQQTMISSVANSKAVTAGCFVVADVLLIVSVCSPLTVTQGEKNNMRANFDGVPPEHGQI